MDVSSARSLPLMGAMELNVHREFIRQSLDDRYRLHESRRMVEQSGEEREEPLSSSVDFSED
jgi:hypothetical protein